VCKNLKTYTRRAGACIPAEEEEVGTGEERRNDSENVFRRGRARNTAEYHHYNDAVGRQQHGLGRT